jgi:hypothetical protein
MKSASVSGPHRVVHAEFHDLVDRLARRDAFHQREGGLR